MENREFRFLRKHIGSQIKLDRGGPESQKGQLLSVQFDHLILHGEDNGIYYCRCDHIKSVSVSMDNTDDCDSDKKKSSKKSGKKSDKKSGKKSEKKSDKKSEKKSGDKKSGKGTGKRSGNRRCGRRRRPTDFNAPKILHKGYFKNLLWTMENQTIQINRGGPEKVQGTLREGNGNFLVLENDNEMINIPMRHIRSIQWLPNE